MNVQTNLQNCGAAMSTQTRIFEERLHQLVESMPVELWTFWGQNLVLAKGLSNKVAAKCISAAVCCGRVCRSAVGCSIWNNNPWCKASNGHLINSWCLPDLKHT